MLLESWMSTIGVNGMKCVFFCLADKVAEGVDVGAFRGLEGRCKIGRVSFQDWMNILCCVLWSYNIGRTQTQQIMVLYKRSKQGLLLFAG